jgi:dienelactone hydrolase
MKLSTRMAVLTVLLAVLVYFSGYLLPARSHTERATFIDVVPEIVYGLMSDLRQFEQWAPWHDQAPDVKYGVEQPGQGLGAVLNWQSQDSGVGAGRLSIIDAQPYNKLRMLLEYDNGERAVLAYHLDPLEGGTHIDWTLDLEHGDDPFSRYKGLLVERRIAAAFEPGLDRLRRLAERQPARPESNIVSEEIRYQVGEQSFTGYIAYDQNRQNRPGVLIVHEWWGHNDYVRQRAGQLAELGYVALALDMYGDGKQAEHPGEAGKLAGAVNENFEAAKERFTAALDILKQHSATDPGQIAAIGYCFGGGIVLNMARAGVDLDGVVSFHGSLQPVRDKARQGEVKAGMLVLNGADDPMVTPEQRQEFIEEMDAAGVDYEFVNYPGATHAFTNPAADEYAKQFDLPLAYDPNADKQSWQQMLNFFDRIFR